jgi:hypothetical protein
MDKSQQAYSEWYRECAGQPNELRVIWDAAWQASRKQALESARDECAKLFLGKPLTSMGKVAHVHAIRQCLLSIRSLEASAKETT